jgi:phage gpG-like protein
MSIRKTGKPLADQLADFRKVYASLPRLVGTEAVVFAKRSFDTQGFRDTSFTQWKPLDAKSLSKRHARKGRKALILTGALKRSIRITHIGKDWVAVGTDARQAKLHNEGGTIRQTVTVKPHQRKISQAFGRKLKKQVQYQVKAHKRNMNLKVPQRQFLGHSHFFNRRIEMQINYKIKQALGLR